MRTVGILLAVTLSASSCTGFLFSSMGENVDVTDDSGHEMIVLGEHLEDPYSLDNMTKALQSLYGTKADRVVLEATDLYVRFLPEDEDQFGTLAADGVEMLDHPVDYRIVKEGDYYHDPEVEEGKITWQYAVVDKDYDFPEEIRYEVLDDCYLSENDRNQSTKADWIDWSRVERESFRLTGNGEMLAAAATKAGDGCPTGTISIYDGKLGAKEGVKGVKVSCNSFVKFGHAYTDESGRYRIDKNFSSDVRYRMVFKNKKGFAIGFNLLLVPASVSSFGKHSPDGLDIDIDSGSERKLFCRSVVNNAGYDYYEDCVEKGIQAPPANLRIWLFQLLGSSSAPMLQQGALIDNSIISEFLGDYSFLLKMFLPDLTLGMKGKYDYPSIYSTAIHELSHSCHFMSVGTSFWDRYIKYVILSFVTAGFTTYGVGTEKDHGYCEIGEMWAYYSQSMFYRERYSDQSAIFGTSYWFRPGIFLDLDERGMSRQSIYKALSSDVNDIQILQKKLLSLYPEMKTVINQAFE